jgi:hypothetical protein
MFSVNLADCKVHKSHQTCSREKTRSPIGHLSLDCSRMTGYSEVIVDPAKTGIEGPR